MVVAMQLLASGRTADVFVAGEGRVLRRYRAGWPTDDEAAVMSYVAGLGYPVPAVYEVTGADIVMERIEGPTMVEAMMSGVLTPEAGMRMLADLHTALHSLPARLSTNPTDRVIHLDLHPENVIMSARGPIVIDWNTADDGPPDLDVALTALILAEVGVGPANDLAELAAAAVKGFLSYTGAPASAMIDRALAIRSANPSLSDEEKARLSAAVMLLR